MRRAREVLLVDRARQQRGFVTLADAAELRVRPRAATWRRVLPGVLGSALLPIDRDLLEAAAMLWAPGGGLSHFSAARKIGIWTPHDDRAWIAVPFADRHRSRPGLVVVRTRHPVPLCTDGFFRWVPAARTIVDLAQCLDERALSAVLLSAVRRNASTAAEVVKAAEPLRGRAGLHVLLKVTGLWTPERESLLEDELVADVTAVTELTVERQYDVRDRSGILLGRGDVVIAQLRLVFEADGLLFHSTDAQIAADQRRDRRFLAAGWQTARFREGAWEGRAQVRRDLADIIDERRRTFRAA